MTDPLDTSTPADDIDSTLSELSFDSDGDGYAETTMFDSDGDGIADAVLYEDASGALIAAADTDGDGTFDTIATDYDGDGYIDEAIVDLDGDGIPDGDVDPTADPTSYDDPFVTDDPIDDPTIEDPTIDDGMHGEPVADMEYHQVQPGPVDCLPTSVAMSLTELTGTEVPADDVVALANENGFMTDAGMSAEDSLALFEAYGVDAELQTGTVDGLCEALDAGDTIVVGIDAADVYYDGGGPFDPGMESGHAVVITGIDTESGMVYINDPGFPDGAGVEIPIELFEDAWEDSDNTMVVATPNADVAAADIDADIAVEDTTAVADDAAVEDVEDVEAAGLSRLLLIPMTFSLAS